MCRDSVAETLAKSGMATILLVVTAAPPLEISPDRQRLFVEPMI
jgi:hypothetical protein